MNQEEWALHSIEWKRGWSEGQNAILDCTQVYYDQHSDEWKAGFMYARQHPIGPVMIPQ